MYFKPLSLTVVATMLALSTLPGHAGMWTVDKNNSSLGFSVPQAGNTLTGVFATWDAEIDFDPSAPENAVITARVNPASASTGNGQFDGVLLTPDWFDTSAFPEAEFASDAVTLIEGNRYRATGTLTIRGTRQPVTLDFTLDIKGDEAHAKGSASVARTAYSLGTSVTQETVGDAVTVTLDLSATR